MAMDKYGEVRPDLTPPEQGDAAAGEKQAAADLEAHAAARLAEAVEAASRAAAAEPACRCARDCCRSAGE